MTQFINWKNPDYMPIFAARVERLRRLRADPSALQAVAVHYRENISAFIDDWGMTTDPRRVERGLHPVVPFLLFPKQREFVHWTIQRWRAGEPGLVEKSRDSGATWLSVAVSCALCLFNPGMVIGFGSRKSEYVDLIGSPKSIFEKIRFFMARLPAEFLQGWTLETHSRYMRVMLPNGSAIVGEAGDGIGRGDRTSIYWLDEAAFVERPELIDASLSATTNCRLDISTPNGFDNSFAVRRHSGRIPVFTFSWRDDPRKGLEWYLKQQQELDPVTLAREVDLDYFGSSEGQLIPSAWVQSAIGAAQKLNIPVTGGRFAGLDVADEGRDRNAMAFRTGIELQSLQSWSGKGSDIYKTTARAFALCDELGYEAFHFDNDGLGAGVRGDALRISDERAPLGLPPINALPYRGSESPPDVRIIKGRESRDAFANCKAAAWWSLRLRFEKTHFAVTEGRAVEDPDALISIRPDLPGLSQLCMELAQPTWSINAAGKILVDKQPSAALSPNLADAVVIAFQPGTRTLETWLKLAAQI